MSPGRECTLSHALWDLAGLAHSHLAPMESMDDTFKGEPEGAGRYISPSNAGWGIRSGLSLR